MSSFNHHNTFRPSAHQSPSRTAQQSFTSSSGNIHAQSAADARDVAWSMSGATPTSNTYITSDRRQAAHGYAAMAVPTIAPESLEAVRRAKGEAEAMLRIVREKLEEAKEEVFDLRANMVAIEAESQFMVQRATQQSSKEKERIEARMAFMEDQMIQLEKSKQKAVRELKTAKQQIQLEQKRMAAERRLNETKKRRHIESLSQQFSQQLSQTNNSVPGCGVYAQVGPQPTHRPKVDMVNVAVQAEPLQEKKVKEDSELIRAMKTTLARDILGILNFTADGTNSEPQLTNEISDSFSKNVSDSASSEEVNDDLRKEKEPKDWCSTPSPSALSTHHGRIRPVRLERASVAHLSSCVYEAVSNVFCARQHSNRDLLQSLVAYLVHPNDIQPAVLCSVLRVLLCLFSFVEDFSVNVTCDNPRVTFGSIDRCALEERDEGERSLRPTEDTGAEVYVALLHGCIRIMKTFVGNSSMTQITCELLLVLANLPESSSKIPPKLFLELFSHNVLEHCLLHPNSTCRQKSIVLELICQFLARSTRAFETLEQSVKETFLFNRLAKRLIETKSLREEEEELTMKLQILAVFCTIVSLYSSRGLHLLLENTKGESGAADPNQDEGFDMFFCLVKVMDQCSLPYRVSGRAIQREEDCVDRQAKQIHLGTLHVLRTSFALFCNIVHEEDLDKILYEDECAKFYGSLPRAENENGNEMRNGRTMNANSFALKNQLVGVLDWISTGSIDFRDSRADFFSRVSLRYLSKLLEN